MFSGVFLFLMLTYETLLQSGFRKKVVILWTCDWQVNLGLPCPQRVVQLPDIAWEQYTSGLGDFEREFCDKKRKTRQLKLIFDKGMYAFSFRVYTQ